MYLARVHVTDYKSFLDSGPFDLSPSRSVIVGRNGAGKTSLTEVLSLRFASVPHRSPATIPTRGHRRDTESLAIVTLGLTREELLGHLRELTPEHRVFRIALPATKSGGTEADSRLFTEQFFEGTRFTLTVSRSGNNVIGASKYPVIARADMPYLSEVVSTGIRPHIIGAPFQFDVVANSVVPLGGAGTIDAKADFGFLIAGKLFDRIYTFRAERTIAPCAVTSDLTLHPSAANLASVLATMQGNAAQFARFKQLVSAIFPHIRSVSVRHLDNGIATVVVWNHDPDSEREDLAVPLAESGTGTGQVLAMLYVLVTASGPHTIIIDEPQSFLHPGAARALIDVMRSLPNHQYILATHSPALIAAFLPEIILDVELHDMESRITALNPASTEHLRRSLLNIGASFADVFGADRVLWVEGPTEETCFRMIAAYFNVPMKGAVIARMRSTSGFMGKNWRLVFDLYDTISRAAALLPEPAAFVFDLEERNNEEIEDIRRRARGRALFTAEPMFENYVLHSAAITALINEFDNTRLKPLQCADVDTAISRLREAYKLKTGTHAAKLLSRLLPELTGARVAEFDKVPMNVWLTSWLLRNEPEFLRPLADLITKAVES